MKTWKAEITISVADSWIVDGFNLTETRLNKILEAGMEKALPYAYAGEISVGGKISKEPPMQDILRLQNGSMKPKD